MKIKIMTDGAAEFTAQEAQKEDIKVMDIPVSLDGEEHKNISLDMFWKELIDGKTARTSQPSAEAVRLEFEKVKREGYALIYICISSRLSGTYETACAVQREVGCPDVFVVDSLSATAGEKIIVLEALRLARKELPAREIAERLEKFRSRVQILACIDTLKYLARGGRLSGAAANIGTLLNLKPIIRVIDGEVKVVGKALGKMLAMKHMVGMIDKDKVDDRYNPLPIFAYDATNCNDFLQKLSTAKSFGSFGEAAPIGPIIGSYIGPGGFGIVYVEK